MKLANIIRWIGVAVFGILAVISLASGSALGAVMFILGGAIITPSDVIKKLLDELEHNKVLAIILVVVFLFAGIFAMPITEKLTDNHDGTQIIETVSNNTSSNDKTANTSIDVLLEITSKTEEISSKVENSSKLTTTSQLNTSFKEQSSLKPVISSNFESYSSKVEIPSSRMETPSKLETSSKSSISSKTETSSLSESSTKPSESSNVEIQTENIPQEDNSEIVYKTETGKKYHSTKTCRYLSRSKVIYELTLSDAKEQGLGACSGCY